MLPYFYTVAPNSEPEGWDAANILRLENPLTGRWSCPTLTKRNRRCENVVSQDRMIKVKPMVDSMSVEDASKVEKDENRELTALAELMLCPLHTRAADRSDKVKAVVAEWRNHIKTSMRAQAQPRTVRHRPQAPGVGYPPISVPYGLQARRLNTPSERTATVSETHTRSGSTLPDTQTRSRSTSRDTTSAPQSPPPNCGATLDREAVDHMMTVFQTLSLENQELKEQNRTLRDDNARLRDKEKAAATEHKRTEGVLEVVEEERSALSDQVDELFWEINSLRRREDRHLEKISALEEAVQQTSRTYRRLKKVWTAASVVPKGDGGGANRD